MAFQSSPKKKDKQVIGNELGFDKFTLKEISHYYLEKIIEYPTTGSVEITVLGMDYVEELMVDSMDVQTVKSYPDKILKRLYDVRTRAERSDMWSLMKNLELIKKPHLT